MPTRTWRRPPAVIGNSIPISNGVVSGDFGYKTDIRDWKDFAPRVGFTYNVGGSNDLVIRGGTGIYFASPVSNVTYSPKVYSNLLTASFANDGRADFITNPTNGVTGDEFFSGRAPSAGAVAARHRRRLQEPVHVAEQHRLPEADQQRDRHRRGPHPLQRIPRHPRRSIRICSSIRQPATTGTRRGPSRIRRTARC